MGACLRYRENVVLTFVRENSLTFRYCTLVSMWFMYVPVVIVKITLAVEGHLTFTALVWKLVVMDVHVLI